jgi:ribose 5-phosphate isomerase B
VKIAIGCDHGGFRLKMALIGFLRGAGHSVRDFGCYSGESCDYPVFAAQVGGAVGSGRFRRGILVCKTGIGMAMSANKIKGVRAAVIHNLASAVSSREHNDSNIIVFGSRFIGPGKAARILSVWLKTRALGGRHRRRVRLMGKLEVGNK